MLVKIIGDRLWSPWKEVNTTPPKLHKNTPKINQGTEFCSIFQNFGEEDCILHWSITSTLWRGTQVNLSYYEENEECQVEMETRSSTLEICVLTRNQACWWEFLVYSCVQSGFFFVNLNFKADTGVLKLMQYIPTLVYFSKGWPDNQ